MSEFEKYMAAKGRAEAAARAAAREAAGSRGMPSVLQAVVDPHAPDPAAVFEADMYRSKAVLAALVADAGAVVAAVVIARFPAAFARHQFFHLIVRPALERVAPWLTVASALWAVVSVLEAGRYLWGAARSRTFQPLRLLDIALLAGTTAALLALPAQPGASALPRPRQQRQGAAVSVPRDDADDRPRTPPPTSATRSVSSAAAAACSLAWPGPAAVAAIRVAGGSR